MKKHRSRLALGILVLMATFQQEALCRQPVFQTSPTDPKNLRAVQTEWILAEILIEVPAGVMTARGYFINRRGYQLLAAPAASGSDLGNVKRFLDSFKVTAQ